LGRASEPSEPPTSSPTPASQAGGDARRRILDASQKLFAISGFDATPVKRIADEAGVPASLIFYYFDSKQKLLEDLLRERNLLPELEQILRSAPEARPREGLLELGRRFLDVVTRREAIARILMRESSGRPQVAERWRELRESAIRIIATYLQGAVERGSLRTTRAPQLARIFLYNLIFAALIDEAQDLDHWLREMVDTLLEGILSL
jgi:AcrR family transcriptional regulator